MDLPLGLTLIQLDTVLTAAGRAPSLHNSQPWKFSMTTASIQLHADHSRALPGTDPDGREMLLSCGAALLNLRLAVGRAGVAARVTLFPAGVDGPIASIESDGVGRLSPESAELERAIVHRRTNRRPFLETDIEPMHRRQLVRAAQLEGATAEIIDDPARLASLRQWSADAHHLQMADPLWLQEWKNWTGRVGGPTECHCDRRARRQQRTIPGPSVTSAQQDDRNACQIRTLSSNL
ncbi:hypothetical protein [Nakamurella antarctica]|uniref:hypothetical protein n=1 Tax=Nakamurella antarctica TaxID=1902245 RepID=UPI001EF0BDEB|nr:hypothetical protein [Nakamurella antarctica]